MSTGYRAEVIDLTAYASVPPAASIVAHREILCLSSDDEGTTSTRYKTDPNERLNREAVTRRRRKRQRTEAPAVEVLRVKEATSPKYYVLSIFPDADLKFIEKTLLRYDNSAEQTIAYMLDNPSFPTDATKKSIPPLSSSVTVSMEEQDEWKHDYMSSSSFDPGKLYKEQAEATLLFDCKYRDGIYFCKGRAPTSLHSFEMLSKSLF